MNIHFQIIHPRDFLIAKANGVLDKVASISVLAKIVEDHPEGEDLLIDLRKIEKFATSMLDVIEIITYMIENRKVFRYKIAIVGNINRVKQPEFVENFAFNRGLNLKIFGDFEEAIMWLMRTSSQ